MTDEPEASAGPVLTGRHWDRHVQLAFSAYQPIDSYLAEYLVTASADGLQVTSPVITSLGGDDLAGFIYDLAEDFRGWQGVRSWRSLESQLRIEATWSAGGHVALRFHLTPSIYDKWTVSVDITLEAGEQMRRLSEDFRAFLRA